MGVDAAGTPKEKDGAETASLVTADIFVDASSNFVTGAENPNEIGAVLADVSALASHAAVAPELKCPAAGFFETITGAVNLNSPDSLTAADLLASLVASAAGAPKPKPPEEISAAGFSASFFKSRPEAPKLKPFSVIKPAIGFSAVGFSAVSFSVAGFSACFSASSETTPKLNPLDEIFTGAFGAADKTFS